MFLSCQPSPNCHGQDGERDHRHHNEDQIGHFRPFDAIPSPRLLFDYRAYKQPNRLHTFNTRVDRFSRDFYMGPAAATFEKHGVSNFQDTDGQFPALGEAVASRREPNRGSC